MQTEQSASVSFKNNITLTFDVMFECILQNTYSMAIYALQHLSLHSMGHSVEM